MLWLVLLIPLVSAVPRLPLVKLGDIPLGFTKAAERLKNSMNLSVDPCQDFFEFSCGQWIANNPIPGYTTARTQFTTDREKVQAEMKNLYESKDAYKSKAINMVRSIYKACMDIETIDKLGTKNILKEIETLGYFPLLHGSKWKREKFDLTDFLIKIIKSRGLEVFFDGDPSTDIKNTSRRLLSFDQASLGLGRRTREFYMNQTKFEKQINAYKNLQIGRLTLLTKDARLPVDVEKIKQGVDAVVAFETEYAKMMTPEEERRDFVTMYRLARLDDLDKLVPIIKWKKYLLSYTPTSIHDYINSNPEIVIYLPKFFERLNKFLVKADPEVLTNYVFFRYLADFSLQMGSKYEKLFQEFAKEMYGRKEQPERWKDCVLDTNDLMRYASGSLFVRKHFSSEAKESTLSMIVDLQEAFHEILQENNWMDKKTKSFAQMKAKNMEKLIGYPEFILDDKKLDDWYKELEILPNEPYDRVMSKVNSYAIDYNYKRLMQPVDRMEWNENPGTVNAFYSHIKNGIIFPAAMLQPPFFVKDAPKALNYGAIGSVIGHEVTHGFDDQGRQFDETGNLRVWWDNATAKNYNERAKCIMEQYSNISVPDTNLNINGRLTLGENIADNGGVKESFRGYTKYLERHGEEKRLPGMEQFDNLQLFFIGYAQNWCSHATHQHWTRLLLTDAHCPGKYRINVVLGNQPEFAKAFKCAPNTPMNPAHRCGVW